MKCRVVKSFIDKYSMESIKKDTVIELTKGRFEEINSTASGVFVEKIKAKSR